MEIMQTEEGKVVVLGGVRVPLNEALSELINGNDGIKSLSIDQHVAIVRGAGLEVPEIMFDDYAAAIAEVAMSIAQQAWFECHPLEAAAPYSQDARISVGNYCTKNHAKRIENFNKLAVEAKAKPVVDKKPLGPVGEPRHRIKPGDLPTPRHAPKFLQGTEETALYMLAITLDSSITLELPKELKDVVVDNPALAEALLHAAGYDVPAGIPFESLKPLATIIAQRHWHEYVAKNPVPDDFDYVQKLSTKQFNVLTGKFRKKASRLLEPEGLDNTTQEPEEPREPRVRPATRVRTVNFMTVPGKSYEAGGQPKAVYDAVVAVVLNKGGQSASVEEIVAEAESKGFATKEPAGNAPRISWLAKELVKKGILTSAT